jgi:hypothetical protein
MFRQGDVLLVPVRPERLPNHFRPLPRDARGRLVLALGEVTGHAHAAIPLPAGLYRVVRQREYAPGWDGSGWQREVAD